MTISRDAQAVLTEMLPYLERIAHKIHKTSWQQADPEDLLQEMCLWFLEKYGQSDHVLDNTPGYYSRGAAWHARHWARDTYTRHHNGKRIAWADPLPEWYVDRIL